MNFEEFIRTLSYKDKENYDRYSVLRGKQSYKIIYECLSKIDNNISYTDVNSFIRYDKKMKDILYIFLGSLEEYIKNYIFTNYDFKYRTGYDETPITFYNQLPDIEKKTVCDYEITELYKRYGLNFKDMVDLLKDHADEHPFDIDKLYMVKELRNDVMHHTPLLFNYKNESTVQITNERIMALIELLPSHYRECLCEDLNDITTKTMNNTKERFNDFVLKIF